MADQSPGPLSMERIRTMSESDFRTAVLIPIFRNMGYLDVVHYHGGSLEQGKDIVMWKRTELGRRNYAVVAKAKRITGQAEGKGSAAEVAFQINQCFGRRYIDGVSSEEQQVHECIVACPHELKTDSRHAIGSALDERLARHVTYMHGDMLWQLITKHLGPRAAIAQLSQVGQVLEESNPNYRIVARTKGAQVQLAVEPKHPDAITREPLLIKAQFAFPNDEAGQMVQGQLVKHFDTGSPAAVPGQYISELVLPDLLRSFIDDKVGELRLEPITSNIILPVTFEVESSSGERISITDLPLRCIQKGSLEATLTAERLPYEFAVVLYADRRVNMTVGMDIEGVNVVEALQAIRLRRIMSQGCKSVIRDGHSRLPFMSTEVAPGVFSHVDPEGKLEQLLMDVVRIQEITHTPIPIPTRDFRYRDFTDTKDIALGVTTGMVPIEHLESLNVTLGRGGIEQLVDAPPASSMRFAVVAEETVSILDTEVRVGPVARIIEGGTLSEAERARMKAALDDLGLKEMKVDIDCRQAQSIAIYLDHVPSEDLQKYQLMFPNLG